MSHSRSESSSSNSSSEESEGRSRLRSQTRRRSSSSESTIEPEDSRSRAASISSDASVYGGLEDLEEASRKDRKRQIKARLEDQRKLRGRTPAEDERIWKKDEADPEYGAERRADEERRDYLRQQTRVGAAQLSSIHIQYTDYTRAPDVSSGPLLVPH